MQYAWRQSAMIILGAFAVFLTGTLAGFELQPYYERHSCRDKYKNVNAALICEDNAFVISKGALSLLRRDIVGYIEEQKAAGLADHVSVYVRDLHNGPTMGINEADSYAPASLLKLPLALVYMSVEEDDPGFLVKQPALQFERPPEREVATNDPRTASNLRQAFEPPEEIKPGVAYKLDELLFRMLAYSDNNAYVLLVEHMYKGLGGEMALKRVFQELGVINPENIADETVSVRGYAGIFRQLYNGTYLTPELSERVLGWLSQSSFDEGIEAGVPNNVRVAHKFGERELGKTKIHQLHDCGIVYFPDNPYVICIMTRGKRVDELAPIVAHISKMTYDEFETRRVD